jgi:hypothetical protein
VELPKVFREASKKNAKRFSERRGSGGAFWRMDNGHKGKTL